MNEGMIAYKNGEITLFDLIGGECQALSFNDPLFSLRGKKRGNGKMIAISNYTLTHR